MGKIPDTAYSLLPIAAPLVDLPIDHFRLLGVSPAADAQAILRSFNCGWIDVRTRDSPTTSAASV